jgi:hypothetical protein
MTDREFEKELKKAVHEVCLAMATWDASPAVPYSFSKEYTNNLNRMLCASERRLKRKRMLLRVAACFVALLVAFAAACAISPKVWAAVRSWYVNIVSPDRLVYEFNHEKNDHAFLVVRPDSLPEGFELTDIDEGDGYSNQVYKNPGTGEYLKFSYHWATVGDLKTLEKLEKKHGQISIFMGQQAVSYTENSLSKLFWYDKYTGISYRAESNMDQEALVNVFKQSIEMHLPIYEPTWLPDGYFLYDTYMDGGSCNLTYYNKTTDSIIVIECGDLGLEDRFYVDGTGSSKTVLVNNKPATVYWGQEQIDGTVLVMIDESRNTIISVYTGVLDPNLVVSVAKSLTVVDTISMHMP